MTQVVIDDATIKSRMLNRWKPGSSGVRFSDVMLKTTELRHHEVAKEILRHEQAEQKVDQIGEKTEKESEGKQQSMAVNEKGGDFEKANVMNKQKTEIDIKASERKIMEGGTETFDADNLVKEEGGFAGDEDDAQTGDPDTKGVDPVSVNNEKKDDVVDKVQVAVPCRGKGRLVKDEKSKAIPVEEGEGLYVGEKDAVGKVAKGKFEKKEVEGGQRKGRKAVRPEMMGNNLTQTKENQKKQREGEKKYIGSVLNVSTLLFEEEIFDHVVKTFRQNAM